ncbi:Ferrous iron transporter FeoB [Olavius algarvensis associated proteobacterium Delta 3]|nr:Ferrous iron transporter FeoB [Olavius algarvensis associated proteobacterium Delta 3]
MGANILSIALSGNPNSGKTTIFNNITGTRQKVGNWPGVTVEKKEGRIQRLGRELKIIDLPGTYSLTPFSIEEIVARNYILEEHPDVVIDIIDSSNLERSLYLATQLRELDCRVVFALNMTDLAKSRGINIDVGKLSELLDVQIVATVGNKNEGIDDLIEAAVNLAESDHSTSDRRRVKYSIDIEAAIGNLQSFLEAKADGMHAYDPRWTAIKLIEDDKVVKQRVLEATGRAGPEIVEKTDELRRHLFDRFADDPEIVMTDERYGFIAGIIKEVQTTSTRQRVDTSRNIDLVLTNRFVGFPIFILFIWIMFQLTFTFGDYPMQWIESGVGLISAGLDAVIPDSLFKDMLLNGIVAGVGSVIIFLPNILILFFCIALFEDTGYMSRAAFLMDKIMHLIGLHGKSFIPMLMGFGCNVPAILAARTLESEKDRILTILITPFMSCSARLPVYIVLAGTFFGAKAGSVIFGVYVLGIVLSILVGRLFRSSLLKGADAPFVMELPPYRIPMFKSLLIHMWDRSKMFLKKMGGVILIGSLVVWALSSFPRSIEYRVDYDSQRNGVTAAYEARIRLSEGAQRAALEAEMESAISELNRTQLAEKAEKSYMGRIGKVIAPVFAPLGIDWRGGVALVTGFFAKEIVVSTLGVLYAVGDDQSTDALKDALKDSGMTPLGALAMMAFVLLYVPCLATITTIRQEAGVKWTLFNIVFSTGLAWLVGCLIYQGGRMVGLT